MTLFIFTINMTDINQQLQRDKPSKHFLIRLLTILYNLLQISHEIKLTLINKSNNFERSLNIQLQIEIIKLILIQKSFFFLLNQKFLIKLFQSNYYGDLIIQFPIKFSEVEINAKLHQSIKRNQNLLISIFYQFLKTELVQYTQKIIRYHQWLQYQIIIKLMYKFFEHLYKRDQLEVILQQTGLMNPSKSVKFNKLKKFSKYLEQDENRIRLIEFLKKQLNNLNWNIRLKVNIVFHYILIANHHKSNYIKSFIQMYLSHDFLKSNLNSENKENMEQCIKINIIDQYSQYLIKYCISFDLYQICLKFKYMLSAEDIISTRVLTDAYRVINNINMIINQHENMNKMGRYYKKQKIMVDLYTMYLKNLGVYYEYLKRICQLILNNYQKFKKQSVAQYFLLFNEAEKSLGKVQDFFSIRYYRYDLRNITYPKYFIVDYIKYQQFAIYAKWLETSLKKEICNLEGIMDDSTRNIY